MHVKNRPNKHLMFVQSHGSGGGWGFKGKQFKLFRETENEIIERIERNVKWSIRMSCAQFLLFFFYIFGQ